MINIRKGIALVITLALVGMIIQPTAAWGEISHIVIVSKLNPNDYDKLLMKTFPKYAKGGGIGPDMFYYSSESRYSELAHTEKTAQLPGEMMTLASEASTRLQRAQQRAYVDGWWSHFAADIRGHQYYVNTFDPSLHYDVEVGVDANLANKVSDYSFSVPYGLVQEAYGNVYGTTHSPSAATILGAVTLQQTAIYIERIAIFLGIFNTQKRTYTDFWDVYQDSISDSEDAIDQPPTQDYDLNTGFPISSSSSLLFSSTVTAQAMRNKPDKDIIDTANEVLESGAIEVVIEDDKVNKVFHVKEPSIKDKDKFDKAIEKLAKKKKGKK